MAAKVISLFTREEVRCEEQDESRIFFEELMKLIEQQEKEKGIKLNIEFKD